MSWTQRQGFTPADPLGLNAQALDQLWQAAQERWAPATSALDGAFSAMGEFATQDIERAIEDIRDTAAPARQVFNQIRSILSSPCGEDWTIIIDTLLPAMGAAFWILVTPSPGEVVEEFLNPARGPGQTKGGRDNRSRERAKTKSGRARRRWTSFTDVDELVASVLPLRDQIAGRPTSLPTRWVFHGIAALDIAALTAMLADITHEGMVLWQSGLMESRLCNDAMDVWQTAFMTQVPKDGAEVPAAIPPWSVSVQKGMSASASTIGAPIAPIAGGASASLRVDHDPYTGGQPITATYSITAQHADGTQTTNVEPVTINPGDTSHSVDLDIAFNNATSVYLNSSISISNDVFGPSDFVIWGMFEA